MADRQSSTLLLANTAPTRGLRSPAPPTSTYQHTGPPPEGPILEIDARFFADFNGNGRRDWNEEYIDNLSITCTEMLGASTVKWSYYSPSLVVYHEAHVEASETGRHKMTVANQPACTVGGVSKAGKLLSKTDRESVTQDLKGLDSVWVDVASVP